MQHASKEEIPQDGHQASKSGQGIPQVMVSTPREWEASTKVTCKTHTGPRGGKFKMVRKKGGGTRKQYLEPRG